MSSRDWASVPHDDALYGDADIASAEERLQLDELRSLCEKELRAYPNDFPEVVGDIRLLRFLRGHGSAAAAAPHYRGHLAHRAEAGLDAIRKRIVSEGLDYADFPNYNTIARYMPFNHRFCRTFDAGYVVVQYNGRWDTVGLMNAIEVGTEVTAEGFLEFWDWACEYNSYWLDQDSRRTNTLACNVGIVDFRGVRLAQIHRPFLDLASIWVSKLQTNYPESSRCEIFLNTPAIFSVVWKVVAPILSEGFQRKVQFFGERSLEAHQLLLSLMPSRGLPVAYGGLAPPRSGGCENTDCAPPVTRKMCENRGFTGLPFKCAEDYQLHICPQICVAARQCLELPVQVETAGDAVVWEWSLESLDIIFFVTFTPCKGAPTDVASYDVLPRKHVEALVLESGHFEASEAGTLTLFWDNSASWFNGKTVTYKRIRYVALGETLTEADDRIPLIDGVEKIREGSMRDGNRTFESIFQAEDDKVMSQRHGHMGDQFCGVDDGEQA